MKTEQQLKQEYDKWYNENVRFKDRPKRKIKIKPVEAREALPEKGSKDWYKKYLELRQLNILYFIKKIGMGDFIEKQIDLDDTIILEAIRVKPKGTRIRAVHEHKNERR